jgi:rhodanese-related sulfurtransferase
MDFEISVGQVNALKKRGETFALLDVREPWEYQRCHIEGSQLVPMREIAARAGELAERLRAPDAAAEVVVICHHGGRSMQVAMFLERQGFSEVINLAGGVDAWARTVDPGMPVY